MDIWNINWVTCRLKSNQHRLFLSLDSISEEARKKKKNSPEYQKCWNPLNKPLHSQPSCPHWCSNFTQIYNNGTWPRPATPLSLHKSPLRLQTQTFSCRRDYFFRSPARQSQRNSCLCRYKMVFNVQFALEHEWSRTPRHIIKIGACQWTFLWPERFCCNQILKMKNHLNSRVAVMFAISCIFDNTGKICEINRKKFGKILDFFLKCIKKLNNVFFPEP